MKLVSYVVFTGLTLVMPASATVALNGNLAITAISGIGDVAVSDSDPQSWSLLPLSLNAGVSATNTYRDSVLMTRGQARAIWLSADAGSVLFENFEWDLFSTDSMPPSFSRFSATLDTPDWSYTFTASGNGRLVMNYDVMVGSGSPFGLWGWDVAFSGAGTGAPIPNPNDPTTSGTFVGFLEDGVTYTIGLNTRANIGYGSTSFDYDGAPMRGQFDWSVVYDAPEPGSLIVAAAGMILLARRRVRHTLT